MTTQVLSFTVFFFSFLFARGVLPAKRGASSVHERSDGVMGVCVCVCVRECGISIFLLSSIHHVSCCSMQKEKKGR